LNLAGYLVAEIRARFAR